MGDFCTLYEPVLFAPETARILAETDRPTAERIVTLNRLRARCP